MVWESFEVVLGRASRPVRLRMIRPKIQEDAGVLADSYGRALQIKQNPRTFCARSDIVRALNSGRRYGLVLLPHNMIRLFLLYSPCRAHTDEPLPNQSHRTLFPFFNCAVDVCPVSHALQGVAAQLPAATRVFCGHEYTVGNLQFAAAVEPQSAHVAEKLNWSRKILAVGGYTVPSTVSGIPNRQLFVSYRYSPHFLRRIELSLIEVLFQWAPYLVKTSDTYLLPSWTPVICLADRPGAAIQSVHARQRESSTRSNRRERWRGGNGASERNEEQLPPAA